MSNIMELIEAYADKRHTNGAHYYNTVTLEARAAVVEAVEKLEKDAARYRFLFGGSWIDENYRKCWGAWDGEDGIEGFNRVVDEAMEATNGQQSN